MKSTSLSVSTLEIAMILAIALNTTPAFAYRGLLANSQDVPENLPSAYLPGYFDAGVLRKGQAAFEIPLFTLEYGLTDHLTIGTSAIPWIIAANTFQPVAAGKLRYRFYSTSHSASSLTLYAGGMNIQSNDQITNGYYFNFTSNTSWYLTPMDSVTLHLTALRLSQSTSQGRMQQNLGGTAILPGINYQHFFSDRFGIEGQLMFPALVNVSLDAIAAEINLDVLQGKSWMIPHRILMNFKTGKSTLLSAGLIGAFSPSELREAAFPYLSLTFSN